MTAIRCRWHDAGVAGVPPATPGKQAAAAFALYGLRLQPEGISPGPVEATVTITGTPAATSSANSIWTRLTPSSWSLPSAACLT